MKFRGKMTELLCMKQFSNIIATIAKLAKLCVVRITKDMLYFIIVDGNVTVGKPMVWSVLEQTHFFNEYNMAGVSEEQNEIFLEFEPDVMAKSLNSLRVSNGAKSVKIKLTNKKSPCLTFEIQLSELLHSRVCVHDIPVTVLPRREWSTLQEPRIPDFNVSIQLPSLKLLRTVAERMKTLSPYIILLANHDGTLILKIETAEATVSTHFKDLPVENAGGAGDSSDEFFSARVDVKKFVQFLTCEQVNPNKVVCNILDDQMVAMFLVHEDVTLHYFLPVIAS
ncbi:checkpoint protein HUS1 [Periplaneta americana]|uniref:checkpoint protein HUS1 n=1 Tax=Periplaneta americana TaxID=6978 RepID=UPI0037E7897A